MKRLVLGAVAVLFMVGCGPAQSPECKKYITCENAVTAGAGDLLAGSYGEAGSCWKSSQAVADACTAVCKSNTAARATGTNPPAACQ